jgi:hypothetical protein
MKVINPGHEYEMTSYSIYEDERGIFNEHIIFVKKIGDKLPGDMKRPQEGTNCQEVLRVLINRVKYMDKQEPCIENKYILNDLRDALGKFELRAAECRGDIKLLLLTLNTLDCIEDIPSCEICGHIGCSRHKR